MKIICPPRRTDAADLPRMGGDIVLTLRNRDTDQVEDVLSNGSGAMQVEAGGRYKDLGLVTVSYTHLTLPTTPYV